MQKYCYSQELKWGSAKFKDLSVIVMQTKFYQHWINMTKGYMLLYNSTNDLVNEGHTNNCARVTKQACMLFTRAELKVL